MTHLHAVGDFRTLGSAQAKSPQAYGSADELLHDLRVIQRSLRDNRSALLADEGPLAHLATQVLTFGFHLAALDIRQHSDEHAQAVEEMIAAARILPPGKATTSLDEDDKVRAAQARARQSASAASARSAALGKAQGVLEVFEVMLQAQRHLSADVSDAYMISMTHGVSDLLEVLLLAKEVGLTRWKPDSGESQLESGLDVVPLFETIDDLRRCDAL